MSCITETQALPWLAIDIVTNDNIDCGPTITLTKLIIINNSLSISIENVMNIISIKHLTEK